MRIPVGLILNILAVYIDINAMRRRYMLEHPLATGDGLAFVSHKYHSIQPVVSGVRRSLVIELWEESAKLSASL